MRQMHYYIKDAETEVPKSTTAEVPTSSQTIVNPNVSGSLSVDDCKWLIFYGHTKDKTVVINQDVGQLDYALNSMFMMMKESSRFDSDKVEKLFWERLQALANYR